MKSEKRKEKKAVVSRLSQNQQIIFDWADLRSCLLLQADCEQGLFSFFFYLFSIFFLVVLTEAMRRYRRSLLSFIMLSYSGGVRSLVSLRRSSQYSVSAHSFREIVTLTRNSFLLMEYWASVRLAPIDVPERKSCLASTYSRFSSQRYLYRLYILTANLRLFSRAMFINDYCVEMDNALIFVTNVMLANEE